MKTISLLFLMTLLGLGHSYASDVEVDAKAPHEKAPHEREIVDIYAPILGGERSIHVDIPTDVYGVSVNQEEIHDKLRFPGKVLEGRAPAVLLDKEFGASTIEK